MNTTLPLNQVRRFGWLKSCCAAFLFLAGFQHVATHAQGTLYYYTNATSGIPAIVAPGIETMGTIEDLKRGGGVDTTINCSANQGFGSDGWPTTNTFDVDAFNSSGDYIEFTLDPQAGYSLLITGFAANSRRENPSGTTNDGPASLRYAYSKTGAPGSWTFVNPGNPQASSTCGSLGVTRVWTSFPSVSVSGSETITFRIYGLSSGANMTGDLFLRNVIVSGFVCSSTPSASLSPVSFCEGTTSYDIPVASSSTDITSYSLSFSPSGIPDVSGTLPSPGPLPSVLSISTAMSPDGVYSGTLTLTNSCGVSTVTPFNNLVTINPLPVFNITVTETSGVSNNDGIICPGDDVTLSAGSGGQTYLWSTSGTTSSITVSPAATTTYSVTVTNLGCQQTASQTIQVTAPETANAGPDQSTCVNGSVLLAGSFGGTATGASWSDNGAGGVFLPNANTLNAYYTPPLNNTNPITLTLTTDGPCPVSDDVVISYDFAPVMTLSANASTTTATCNETVTVTLKVEEGFNGLNSLQYSVNWNASAFSLLSQSATPIGGGTPSVATGMGTLTYSWFDPSGSFGEDLPDGTVLLTMTFNVLNSSGAESIDITGAPTTIEGVTWQLCDINISLNNDADINLTPVTPGISITEDSGIENDGIICTGDDITLTTSGGGTYLWSTTATTSSITVSPTSTTTYTVTVTSPGGCSTSVMQVVTVNSLPTASVLPSSITICPGSPTVLMASGGVSYLWNTTATTADITVSPVTATTYT
ncbi:MAG TPA: cohesin domain-containing protein, partial [Saprospiraceae bacterium]|nr:cohesin domain-containing protein [Saprospiraceae bacterium]